MIQRVGILALGALSLVLGCVQTDTDSAESEGELGEVAQAGRHGGINGLSSPAYQHFALSLSSATSQPLVTGVGFTITNTLLLQNLLAFPDGHDVFEYAAACGLRAGLSLTDGNSAYVGGGVLSTTQDWYNAPLSVDARHDLLECMAAHVNPTGKHVNILLSGQNVLEDGQNHSQYDVDEAVWLVKDGVSGQPETHVWPLPTFAEVCKVDPEGALRERVCGKNPVECHLVLRTDPAACTTNSNGYYTCDGHQAIKTTLTTEAFRDLYGAGLCYQ